MAEVKVTETRGDSVVRLKLFRAEPHDEDLMIGRAMAELDFEDDEAGEEPEVVASATPDTTESVVRRKEGVDETPQPEVARLRTKVRPDHEGRVRARTIARRYLTKEEKLLSETLPYPEEVDRPRTREECMTMPRPCPFVSCAHHLYLDVNQESGAIKLNFPHLEVWEMAETCALDVADRGGTTLEEVGAILNLTRERIRQVEVRGLQKIKVHSGDELGLPPDR